MSMNKETEKLYIERINELADDKALLSLALEELIPYSELWWSIKHKIQLKTNKFDEVMKSYKIAKRV